MLTSIIHCTICSTCTTITQLSTYTFLSILRLIRRKKVQFANYPWLHQVDTKAAIEAPRPFQRPLLLLPVTHFIIWILITNMAEEMVVICPWRVNKLQNLNLVLTTPPFLVPLVLGETFLLHSGIRDGSGTRNLGFGIAGFFCHFFAYLMIFHSSEINGGVVL